MAGKYKCNPKIKKFNESIINDKTPAAKRSLSKDKKGTIRGIVYKLNH